MTLFFDVLAVVSLIAAVTNVIFSVYQNSQRKKEIAAVSASVQTLDTEHKSTASTLQADIRRTEGNLHSDISSVRSFAESKALRNTVVVSVADHSQIVRDHKG